MATLSYFLIGPTLITGLIGLMHGPDKTIPTPAEDWHDAVVDVIIPAYNAEAEIDLCIASLARQTLKPRHIFVIDDGSKDNTKLFAEDICERLNLTNVHIIRREKSIGKTPSIEKGAYESDADVEFVLDSDTILVSENYLERLVEELYKGVGIASACGIIYPLKEKDRSKLLADERVGGALREHFQCYPQAGYYNKNTNLQRFARFITNLYRDVMYKFLQKFIYRAEMIFVGTIINPVGCAVAYRRKYVKDIFVSARETLGSDLTTSEDIYIGFAFANEGYRNIQLLDVEACTLEPYIQRLPFQVFLWSSAFLQSVYYFNYLVATPFKAINKLIYKFRNSKKEKIFESRRKIKEQYRQSFGVEITKTFGRPIGWFIFTNTLEKILFPSIFLLFIIFGWWEAFLLTFIFETLISCILVAMSTKGERIKMFFKALLTSPIRYALLLYDLVVIFRFITDLWITHHRAWRK
ncbi:glycosyltransferase [Legionella longbeachae]|uniref:Putative glycosyltransferase, family 2 n=1 Tax=Legionella longbeachae serogroup 1 (strain NSW150) TaxID=661367 RepID=D3HPA1_LEGLN|nr:glycosyltransferase family 2 protein [Legionella longbeachae]VEE01240.1 glycosyltransferase, family 2 [Legionella oakridgensis]HBD7398323.1 glycosyltransferase family 2 protein [Legionella pneumophila]ARB92391.1 glycosyl transferase family 2 [Legionella longbeachae]ARM34428.1 glycosyltransferase family 2 protein [Legionella longbeachae]EEZ96284.1 glycosyl transferase, group 2 domain protein [Legionella longbeachae D-4968]